MSAKYFLDTNIFVYSFDSSQPGKQQRALELIGDALQSRQGIISTQVIQEFLNVATRKFAVPMSAEDCKVYLKMALGPLCEIYPDQALYEASLDLQQATGYAFYDCLILSSALRGRCEILYSEDFQAGQHIGSVSIVNPFAES
jgi:predicted nucleic acid-binding protein